MSNNRRPTLEGLPAPIHETKKPMVSKRAAKRAMKRAEDPEKLRRRYFPTPAELADRQRKADLVAMFISRGPGRRKADRQQRVAADLVANPERLDAHLQSLGERYVRMQQKTPPQG